jgi:hypothetical protein
VLSSLGGGVCRGVVTVIKKILVTQKVIMMCQILPQ